MRHIKDIAEDIVAREGGYVNDPDDPGGATKYGVTLHSLQALAQDINGDGQIDLTDLHALRKEDAAQIFLQHYFFHPQIDHLPKSLQATVFDMQVNAGRNAVKILQRLLNQMGHTLAVDGAIGAQTVAAAQRAAEVDAEALTDAYGIARRIYYFRLADRRPASRKFARTRDGGKGGWIKRAEEFISKAYHLTPTEFQQRVAHWS
ncbi:Predicted Peptidoglycan domain-containing protein [Epibacterium ulvae]|uniref:Predicted Peptidoglycan domain-containing protein n=1 Tax=Epibacterium ulvae TaxID=1156985 RepID=A0A1G5Q707_9RHOB|nr:holin-associated N-acetylmuramidase [Epibacterium ulvae]SCZ57356.1 Predicted Peptidoglycan domain-containing protein [Epibacterium ulvae]